MMGRGFRAGMIALVTAAGFAAPTAAQDRDIVETAIAAGSFNTLAAALEAADLVDALQGDGPFTVFAPTDEAFAKLPAGTVESLLEPANRDRLVAILTYHVVSGRVTAAQVVDLDEAETLNGSKVNVEARADGEVRINQADVVQTDVFASNGVIHVIDEVLLPPVEDEDRSARMSPRDAADLRDAAGILTLAIDRGVPLFNGGQPEATAAIYEVAARSVLAGDFGLSSRIRRTLERGLREGGREHGASDRAWAYRSALDRALDDIEGRMTTRSGSRGHH